MKPLVFLYYKERNNGTIANALLVSPVTSVAFPQLSPSPKEAMWL